MPGLPLFVRLHSANIVTVVRLMMVPCFALAVVYYAEGVRTGNALAWQRWTAVTLFSVASLTDFLDGCLARWLKCQTRLGSILDPLADKALLLTALLLLCLDSGNAFSRLPLWFPVVIVSRDLFVVSGVALLWMIHRQVEIKPHWTGKWATVLQMITLGLALLKMPDPYWQIPLWIAGICTITSGFLYLVQSMRHLAISKESEGN
jgi:CDP-diacylglycerol--glycerol-3-phosphate 3-phosphatidyltransferase